MNQLGVANQDRRGPLDAMRAATVTVRGLAVVILDAIATGLAIGAEPKARLQRPLKAAPQFRFALFDLLFALTVLDCVHQDALVSFHLSFGLVCPRRDCRG